MFVDQLTSNIHKQFIICRLKHLYRVISTSSTVIISGSLKAVSTHAMSFELCGYSDKDSTHNTQEHRFFYSIHYLTIKEYAYT